MHPNWKQDHHHLSEYTMSYLQKWLHEAKVQSMSEYDLKPQPGAHNEAEDDSSGRVFHSDGFIPHGNAVLTHVHIAMLELLFEWREKKE